MTQEQSIVLARFNKACGKFVKYWELFADSHFEVSDAPEEELAILRKECEIPDGVEITGKHELDEELRKLKNQIFYNSVVDHADEIYKSILSDAKEIAKDLTAYGFDRKDFLVQVYNMGVAKQDIDDEKEMNESFTGEPVHPPVKERTEPMLDDEALEQYLFG
jgi:hypothetical protein